MGNRTAKFISALFASIVAGVPLAAISQNAPDAAADCLASPKASAPQGQHWYYRIERGTKRQCWYLREEGLPVAQNAPASANAQKTDSSPPHSVQDAHAELASPQAVPAQPAPVQAAPVHSAQAQAAPAQDTTAPTAAVAPRAPQRQTATDGTIRPPTPASIWPDPSSVSTVPQAAPAPQPAETTADTTPAAQPAAAPVSAATAEAPVSKPTGSLQTLLLVIGGALALAGITGSLILRFAGRRARVQRNTGSRRRADWSRWDQAMENSRAPWAEAMQDAAPRTERPRDPLPSREAADEPVRAAGATAREMRTANVRAAHPVDIDALAREIERIAQETRAAAAEAPPSETVEPHVDTSEHADGAVDIDVITAMLERLAQEGPKLDSRLDSRLDPAPGPRPQPAPDRAIAEAGPADFARIRQGRSGARA